MADTSSHDGDHVATLMAVSSTDGITPVKIYGDPTTHRLLVTPSGSGSGTVTSVSVVTANGFAGTVATATTTPAITLSTTITGVLQGNGTTISAATTTGSGNVVLATSPTLVTPVLGVATGTSLALGGGTALTTTNQTGTGNIVLATSPTLVTPTLGVATATTINGNTFTTGTYTLTGTAGKTLNFTNTLTLSGTDSTILTFPATSQAIAGLSSSQTYLGTPTFGNQFILLGASTGGTTFVSANAGASNFSLTFPAVTDTVAVLATAQTLTNKRITKRVLALSAGSATPAINTDSYDVVHITAQSAAITSFTSSLSGTPVDGDTLRISITDNGTARALTWGASFEASTQALPTTTVISTRLDVGFFWNTETSKWRCVAVA